MLVKFAANFYKVQYEHTKQDMAGGICVLVSHFLGYVSAKN